MLAALRRREHDRADKLAKEGDLAASTIESAGRSSG
jgi:hypothetical protein